MDTAEQRSERSLDRHGPSSNIDRHNANS
jgi:hypothetical protein